MAKKATQSSRLGSEERLKLPDVTVCVADCMQPDLAARALEISLDRVEFGDAILFSDRAVDGRFRNVPIQPLRSMADYSRFCLRNLAEHVRTRFVLVIQWDGYVLDPRAWREKFLEVDYIGAPFLFRNFEAEVGNGGFSLRSARLIEATAALPDVEFNEDLAICVTFREKLERESGIRFASIKEARRFSYEIPYLGKPTFGFHGQFNLWRHEDEATVVAIVEALPRASILNANIFRLAYECLQNNRRVAAQAIYRRFREVRAYGDVVKLLLEGQVPSDRIESALAVLEPEFQAART